MLHSERRMTKASSRLSFSVLALAASFFTTAHAAEPRYRDLVLADKPAAYWRFDSI